MPEDDVIVAELVEKTDEEPVNKKKYKNLSRLERKSISALEYRTINNYVEGIKGGEKTSLRQAAIKAGYKKSYAGQAGRRIQELLTQNQSVRIMMEKKGIGLETIVNDLQEIRGATCPPTKYDPNGEHPDNMVRQRNVEFRAQIMDVLPPKRMEVEERKITITITADTLERIKEVQRLVK